jgi:hypothetical protein
MAKSFTGHNFSSLRGSRLGLGLVLAMIGDVKLCRLSEEKQCTEVPQYKSTGHHFLRLVITKSNIILCLQEGTNFILP